MAFGYYLREIFPRNLCFVKIQGETEKNLSIRLDKIYKKADFPFDYLTFYL